MENVKAVQSFIVNIFFQKKNPGHQKQTCYSMQREAREAREERGRRETGMLTMPGGKRGVDGVNLQQQYVIRRTIGIFMDAHEYRHLLVYNPAGRH